ncbi:MAG: DUF3726 domain-containing protein [Mesorhizobium sp.]
MIELSLNEVEMLAAKVARGAGFSWGLCDDIGKCARALAAGGLPWAPSLLALARDAPTLAPPTQLRSAETALSPSGAGFRLCPIRTGALIADSPDLVTSPLQIDYVAHPLWLVGFAVLWNTSQTVSWQGARADVRDSVIAAQAADAGWLMADASVTVSAGYDGIHQPDLRRRADVDAKVFGALGAIAARTYVPASASSRATGAGGSRTDDE